MFSMILGKWHVWEKSCVSVIAQNALNQSDCWIIDHQYLWKELIDVLDFFAWRSLLREGSIWENHCVCV